MCFLLLGKELCFITQEDYTCPRYRCDSVERLYSGAGQLAERGGVALDELRTKNYELRTIALC